MTSLSPSHRFGLFAGSVLLAATGAGCDGSTPDISTQTEELTGCKDGQAATALKGGDGGVNKGVKTTTFVGSPGFDAVLTTTKDKVDVTIGVPAGENEPECFALTVDGEVVQKNKMKNWADVSGDEVAGWKVTQSEPIECAGKRQRAVAFTFGIGGEFYSGSTTVEQPQCEVTNGMAAADDVSAPALTTGPKATDYALSF